MSGDHKPPAVWIALGVVAHAVLIWLGALVSLPWGDVPTTLQSLFVVLAGLNLGRRGGMLTGLLYLAAGALGLPVFADGTAGWQVIAGPSGGYLIGFPLGAWLAGAVADGWPRGAGPVGDLVAAAVGHAVILACGTARLMLVRDAAFVDVWADAGQPFLVVGAVKSVLAAAIAVASRRLWRGPRPEE